MEDPRDSMTCNIPYRSSLNLRTIKRYRNYFTYLLTYLLTYSLTYTESFIVRRCMCLSDNRNVSDSEVVEELLKKAHSSYEILQRQVQLNNMFKTDQLVIETENTSRNHAFDSDKLHWKICPHDFLLCEFMSSTHEFVLIKKTLLYGNW